MSSRWQRLVQRPVLALLAVVLVALPARAQQGVALSGAGPINRSMGGASVAAPLDASGALYWNPATISGLERSEMEFGLEFLDVDARLSSSLAANSLGSGIPPIGLAGSDRSDSGVLPLPSFGLVFKPDCPDWTFGLGVFAIGGFAVNYPASTSNPILTPQPPNGLGLGAVLGELQIMQVAPEVSYKVNDHLSVGFGPTIDLAELRADPAVFATPDDANGDGFATYPSATHTRWHWGGGVQAGLYYTLDDGWRFGTSIKSPQWFETFGFNSADELGQPRTLRFNLDFPLIASVGAAYAGFDRWLLAADLRFIDYHNTPGFAESGFDSTGALRGLGWESIFALALGVQYQVTDPLSLRMGYTYNMNPIDDAQTSFNVASPTIIEHTLYCGASYKFSPCFLVSLAYAHAFENSIHGPIISPLGAIPGSSVQSNVAADTVIVGATVKF